MHNKFPIYFAQTEKKCPVGHAQRLDGGLGPPVIRCGGKEAQRAEIQLKVCIGREAQNILIFGPCQKDENRSKPKPDDYTKTTNLEQTPPACDTMD